jgi:AcrR family transcriptional regulator
MESKRRTQVERSAATRSALVTAARRLFAVDGYAAVGTEAIVQAAGVTRGALYHQFADKAELFAAVVDEIEAEVVERIIAHVGAAPDPEALADPRHVLERGIDGWLDASTRPEVQRIVLLDAPGVLGWERWRTSGLKYSLGFVEATLQEFIDAGALPPQPVRPLAHLVVSAVDEAALYIAQAPDPAVARTEMRAALQRMLSGLLRAP